MAFQQDVSSGAMTGLVQGILPVDCTAPYDDKKLFMARIENRDGARVIATDNSGDLERLRRAMSARALVTVDLGPADANRIPADCTWHVDNFASGVRLGN